MMDVFSPQRAEHIRALITGIKGRSTIALYDGGRKVHEQSNDNMVTDWISKLFNLPQSIWMYNNNSFSAYIKNLMPIAAQLMGGVLLWDDVLPEDADIVYPPAGIGCVGYAGAEYAGANPYRGSYNTNESGAIEGGYRHVFDFPTDKANGTIRALSLTSKKGGNKGWRYGGTDNGFADTYLSDLNGMSLYNLSGNNVNYNGYPIAADFDDTITRVYSYYSGKITRYDLPSAQKVLLNDGRSGASVVSKTDIATVENRSYMYWYDNKFHQVWTSSSTQIRHKSWSINGTPIDDLTISISGAVAVVSSANASYAFFINDHYYVKTTSGWVMLDSTGVFQSAVSTAGSDGTYPGSVCGIVYDPKSGRAFSCESMGGNNGANVPLYAIDLTANVFIKWANNSSYFSSTCTCLQYPWLQCGGNQSSYNNGDRDNSPFDIYPYSMGIATINNLATPVVKTAAQSMKITYEITQEV